MLIDVGDGTFTKIDGLNSSSNNPKSIEIVDMNNDSNLAVVSLS